MIVRKLNDTMGTSREVSTNNWVSRRLILREDQMGFSVHDTIIRAGTSTEMCYRSHLEAVYCIEGQGTVEVLASGETFDIEAGALYALNLHDRHVLTAKSEMRMVCVFNPALVGNEVHDDRGAYPIMMAESAWDNRD